MLGVFVGFILGAFAFFKIVSNNKLHPVARRIIKILAWMVGTLIAVFLVSIYFESDNTELSNSIGIIGLGCAVPLVGIVVFLLDLVNFRRLK